MSTLYLLTGPPFGDALFRALRPRLEQRLAGWRVEALEVTQFGPSAEEAAEGLATRVGEGSVCFAHGLAIPAAVALDRRVALGALLLSNGPLGALSPVERWVVSLPDPVMALLLRPPIWLAWLRSSAGLRRAVANPYAMDRDTVAALCGPPVHSAANRERVAGYLRSLRQLPDAATVRAPLTLIWGDTDDLHPLSEADRVDAALGGGRLRVLPGGRWAHPEEQPWALADLIAEQAIGLSPGPAATPVSQMAEGQAPRTGVRSKKAKVGG